MEVKVTKKEILKELEPMFKEAEEKGLWFNSKYQDTWFSPSELRKNHSEGRLIWGKVNWELRNPKELIEEHKQAIKNYNKSIEDIKKRMSKEKENEI